MADPHAVFARARSAAERADWEALFACLDRSELIVIARNSVNALAATPHHAGPRAAAVFAAHGFPLDTLQARGRDVTESARAMLDDPAPPAEQRRQSLRHRDLVERYAETLEAGLKGVPYLAAFAAALERAMRDSVGGGSVSSRLFVGETLTDLVVEGARARAKRRLAGGAVEDIAFVKKKGDWYIRLPKRRV